MYITYEEYQRLGEYPTISESEFEKLVNKASLVIDNLTRFFYKNHSLEDDVEFRRDAFKMAMIEQVDYLYGNSVTKLTELTSDIPGSVTIGRTSMSQGSGSSSNPQANLYSTDVMLYLSGTGLLYRGLGRC